MENIIKEEKVEGFLQFDGFHVGHASAARGRSTSFSNCKKRSLFIRYREKLHLKD